MKKYLVLIAFFCSANSFADFAEGQRAYFQNDYKTAFVELAPEAKKGNPLAQALLGTLYRNGIEGFLVKDVSQAIDLFKKSGERKIYLSSRYLGSIYLLGEGVPRDYDLAEKWFLRAADDGDPDVAVLLSAMYQDATGTKLDYLKAFKWTSLAAERGNPDAQDMLGMMYASAQGVPRDYVKATEWFQKAAEQNHPAGQRDYGLMIFHGQGVAQSDKNAFFWLRKAAENGDVVAQRNIGLFYFEGRGATQNFIEAYAWLAVALANGNNDAKQNMDGLAQRLTSAQLAEGQRLSAEYHRKFPAK